MVKYSALPRNIVCIIFSVFLLPSIHNYTEGTNHRTDYKNDYKEFESSSAEEKYNKNKSTVIPEFKETLNSNGWLEQRKQPRISHVQSPRGKRFLNVELEAFPKLPTSDKYEKWNVSNGSLNDTASTGEMFSKGDSEAVSSSSVTLTTRGLTLINFNGPIIAEDAESLENNEPINANHIRVKRGFADFADDEESKSVKNELEDLYPDLIVNPVHSNSSPQLIRKKRMNYEMLLPKSETQLAAAKIRDHPSNENALFVNSFSDYEIPAELSAAGLTQPESMAEIEDPKTNKLDFLNPTTSSTPVKDYSSRKEDNEHIWKRKNKRYNYKLRRRKNKNEEKQARKKEHDKSHKPKHKKKHKKKEKEAETRATKRGERNESNPNLISKLQDEYEATNKRQLSHLVDELQVEAHVEKRDSGDAKSEIDINKREISLSRDKRTIDSDKDNGGACSKNGELRYYEDVHEPNNVRTQRDYIEMRPNLDDKTEKEKAAKSVKQIKKLVGKLFDKVNELETFVSSVDMEENKRSKKKVEQGEDSSSNTTSTLVDLNAKNLTKASSDSKICADETDASKLNVNEDKLKPFEKKLSRRQTTKKRLIKKRKSHKKWDRWTDWSSCSVTCGKGRQIRWRHCIHDCTSAETEMEEKSCQLPACSPGKFLGIF